MSDTKTPDGKTLSGSDGAGLALKCGLDGSGLEKIAVGFWNPFGVCVLKDGRIFAVDNDPDASPPCRMVLATLRRMEQTLQEANVEVLSVNQGEAAEQVRQFVAKEGIPFHVVLDPDGAVSASYRVSSLPTMVLIDRRGTVRWIHVGHMPETDELRDVLRQVAKE